MSFQSSISFSTPNTLKPTLNKLAIWTVLAVLTIDTIYSSWYGIHYNTREKCIIYQFLPRWLFLINEYLVELFLVVVAGTFAGVLTEKYVTRYRRFLPKNQFTAFVYASVIPVCSCSAIPLIESMKGRLPLRTIITFVMAAPLLNPYILFLSYSVLGFWYGTLRVVGSFLISLATGYAVELAWKSGKQTGIGVYRSCEPSACHVIPGNEVYRKTWLMVAKIAPYILLAGIMGLLFELLKPLNLIDGLELNGSLWTLLVITGIGTAIYLCNGADILFLAPVLQYTDLGLGNAMAFSLSSTAVCISSIIMLSRFLGKRLTAVLVATTVAVILIFSSLINLVL